MSSRETPFSGFLRQYRQDDWWRVLDEIEPRVHEVDRRATRIWFYFWPLWLSRAVKEADDIDALIRKLELKGRFRLEEQIDSSHDFLYGHRYWPRVKAAIVERAESETAPRSLELADLIRETAGETGSLHAIESALLVGITAVGYMTLQQVGLEAFTASPGEVELDRWALRRSPASILRQRAKEGSQGLFGLLKGLRREYEITFDENHKSARFKLIDGQQLTQAAMLDDREHPYADSRCMPGQGPIPTECRSAACGTCWVGVLAGRERLSPVGKLEGRRMGPRFGYIDTEEQQPIIRLACKARASGNVTVVVPPWNGVAGRWLENRQVAIGGAAAAPDDEEIEVRRH